VTSPCGLVTAMFVVMTSPCGLVTAMFVVMTSPCGLVTAMFVVMTSPCGLVVVFYFVSQPASSVCLSIYISVHIYICLHADLDLKGCGTL
jgi:hypothetical protein